MGALGADAAALEDLAASMRAASRAVGDVALRLERHVRAAGWAGVDAARFERDWTVRQRPGLLQLSQHCGRMAGTLDRQAAEQRRASATPATPAPVARHDEHRDARPVGGPAPLPPLPRVEQRLSGGVEVKVGIVTASIEGDVWLQDLPGERVRVTVVETESVGLSAGLGASAELTVGGTSSTTTPTGGHLAADASLGGLLRRSWEADRDAVPGLLARVAAVEAAERVGLPIGDPRREVEIAGRGSGWLARNIGGLADGVAERLTGVDPGFDDRAQELVTLPAPDRVEALAEVELAAGAGFGLLGVLAPAGHLGGSTTLRAGRSASPGTSSTVVELQGGAAGALSATLLGRLGVGTPAAANAVDALRLELVSPGGGGPDHVLVTRTRTGDSTLDELRIRVDLAPAPPAASRTGIGGLRGLVDHLTAGDLHGALRELAGPLGDVVPTSVNVAGGTAGLSGTTLRGGATASAGLGVGVTARGQVLRVDRGG
jgi:hypothetical protein